MCLHVLCTYNRRVHLFVWARCVLCVPHHLLTAAALSAADVEPALSLSAFPFLDWPSAACIDVSALSAPSARSGSASSSVHLPSAHPTSPAHPVHPAVSTAAVRSPYGRQCLQRCVLRYVHSHLSTRVRREQAVGRMVTEQRETSRQRQQAQARAQEEGTSLRAEDADSGAVTAAETEERAASQTTDR